MTPIEDGDFTAEPPTLRRLVKTLMQPHPEGFLAARYVFLRALGFVFFSAFFSYAYQIEGLIGPHGILPAVDYLGAARDQLDAPLRYFAVPTLFWLTTARSSALGLAVASGLVASILLTLNLAPRICIAICTVLFLSIISVSSVFASYQSDGMLLEAGFLALFLAPGGLRPGLAGMSPPSRIARFMLVWEWFRIYFESGIVKLASGDTEWRNLTALDHYYENGPLPTWIGWYAQHLPHAFHAFTAASILLFELVLVWVAFLPRRFRVGLFVAVTLLQVGIILTANYAFLNYLVLALGFLLVDDRTFRRSFVVVRRWLSHRPPRGQQPRLPMCARGSARRRVRCWLERMSCSLRRSQHKPALSRWGHAKLAVLLVAFCATVQSAPLMSKQGLPLVLVWPAYVFEPFRFANGYGLFAVMTRQRFEIEFQGSLDGKTFLPYPFRYKPQDLKAAPGVYAPYQPRFEWKLWFASLGTIEQNRWTLRTAAALLRRDPEVLSLFAFDPLGGKPPAQVRTVIYRYWFSTLAEHRTQGTYWHRALIGHYAPDLRRSASGDLEMAGP